MGHIEKILVEFFEGNLLFTGCGALGAAPGVGNGDRTAVVALGIKTEDHEDMGSGEAVFGVFAEAKGSARPGVGNDRMLRILIERFVQASGDSIVGRYGHD